MEKEHNIKIKHQIRTVNQPKLPPHAPVANNHQMPKNRMYFLRLTLKITKSRLHQKKSTEKQEEKNIPRFTRKLQKQGIP